MYQYFPNNYSWSLAVSCSIAMGAQISELDEALAPLVPLVEAGHTAAANEAWYQNWTRLGHKLNDLAKADEAAGNGFTASAKYMRAANYYLFAERIASWSDPRRMHVYNLGIAAFRKGLELSGDRWERVEIPFEDGVLSGWLRLADTDARQPALVFYNGFDSIKEMHYLIYAACRPGAASPRCSWIRREQARPCASTISRNARKPRCQQGNSTTSLPRIRQSMLTVSASLACRWAATALRARRPRTIASNAWRAWRLLRT